MNRNVVYHPTAQRRRRDIFVENGVLMNSSSVRSGIFGPDGVLNLFWDWFYIDSAPDGASYFRIAPSLPSVVQCLAARGEHCGAWESEINARVARLYHLTPEEIQLVAEATHK